MPTYDALLVKAINKADAVAKNLDPRFSDEAVRLANDQMLKPVVHDLILKIEAIKRPSALCIQAALLAVTLTSPRSSDLTALHEEAAAQWSICVSVVCSPQKQKKYVAIMVDRMKDAPKSIKLMESHLYMHTRKYNHGC